METIPLEDAPLCVIYEENIAQNFSSRSKKKRCERKSRVEGCRKKERKKERREGKEGKVQGR